MLRSVLENMLGVKLTAKAPFLLSQEVAHRGRLKRENHGIESNHCTWELEYQLAACRGTRRPAPQSMVREIHDLDYCYRDKDICDETRNTHNSIDAIYSRRVTIQ